VAGEKNVQIERKEPDGSKSFFSRYGGNIVIAVLILYLILLLTGTIAEIFHIDSILDWWIWRPMGK
jgi:hypothetical protein